MNWQQMGLIFDTDRFGIQFAKSPQAIVEQNHVRIYFTACKTDIRKKLISYPCYVDYNHDLTKILDFSTTLLPDGDLGCFDEHGIFPFSPIGRKGTVYAYTTGWSRRHSVSVETSIGLVTSLDGGATFQRMGPGPVMAASLNEPFLVADGFVRHYEGKYHMWYIFGVEWVSETKGKEPDRVYKIAHATSEDGISWNRNSIPLIVDVIKNECQALPSVLFWNNIYHMVFCYRNLHGFRENKSKMYRLGYAYSKDLVHWIRNDECINYNFADSVWDSDMKCYPHLVEINGQIYLLYNGNEFGRYGFGAAKLTGTLG